MPRSRCWATTSQDPRMPRRRAPVTRRFAVGADRGEMASYFVVPLHTSPVGFIGQGESSRRMGSWEQA
jgi:hypothetical protein